MDDFESMARDLGSPDRKARAWAAWGLVCHASNGADITAAIPALAKALCDNDADVRAFAEEAFEWAVVNKKSRDAAFSALVNALSDEDIRRHAAGALGKIIEYCTTSAEQLTEMETRLRERYGVLREGQRQRKEGEPAEIGAAFSNLLNVTAKKRNELASKRDILLADIPKPPKGGAMFQTTRRARTYA